MTAARHLAAILAADLVGYMGEDETGTFSCGGRVEARFVELIVTWTLCPLGIIIGLKPLQV
jgi:hypothetical protein